MTDVISSLRFHRAALLYHPDKQQLGDEESKAKAAAKFQQIGFAYAVLSTPARRTRYDTAGRTNESMFEEAMDWNAYFRELWTGEVNADTLDEFKAKYQNSNEERDDILEAYSNTKGHLAEMVDHVPYMSLRHDRERIEEIVEKAIKAKEVKRTKQWDATRRDDALLKAAEKKEAEEEQEAIQMAREMGVYDALFGDQATKAKSRASGQGRAKKRKQAGEEEGEDLSSLQSLIVKRNQARGGRMDNLIAKLEAEAATKKSNKKGKGQRKAEAEPVDVGEPSEEEFARIQARMDAKRNKKAKS